MKIVYPEYYHEFQCVADRCRHNCCIGWEIDIDETTYQNYKNYTGELKNRLQQNISERDTPHFLLGESNRCPFLNEKNLCDIILSMGEDSLCQICSDHPRFRNFFTNYTEMGLGLCCEAAGQLILSGKERFFLPEKDLNLLSEEEIEFFTIRDSVFSIVQDREVPLSKRIEKLFSEFSLSFPEKTFQEWAELYLSLERLEDGWTNLLQKLSVADECREELGTQWEIPFEQLLCYFIYRHLTDAVLDGCYRERILFSVLSTFIVYSISSAKKAQEGEFTMDDLVEIARLYSSEIEYSEENTDTLLSIMECYLYF